MGEHKQFWFPAKRYGWGWGLPIAWQGWAVLMALFVLVIIGALVFLPDHATLSFVGYTLGLTAIFCAICYIKGEPPRWRWGGK